MSLSCIEARFAGKLAVAIFMSKKLPNALCLERLEPRPQVRSGAHYGGVAAGKPRFTTAGKVEIREIKFSRHA
jgi:hypothetical protein